MRRYNIYILSLFSLLILTPLFSPAHAAVGDFLFQWSAGYSFDYPSGIAIDSSRNVYVADTNNNRIQVFSGTGRLLRNWGGPGSENGQLRYPSGIAVDGSGNVYVADTYNHRIQVFTGTGTFLKKWGSYGSGDGQFYLPYAIAIDGNGNVYVADTNNHRIQVFNNKGVFLRGWGSSGSEDGQFQLPYSLTIDGSGNVYVADTNNHRIQVFASNGTFLRKWGGRGLGDGKLYSPSGITVDGNGNVYVSDANNHRIQVFTNTGAFLKKWGGAGSANGQFNYPFGIAVDDSGSVYVADTNNHRIQVFASTSIFLRKWGGQGSWDGQLRYPRSAALDGSGNVYVADTNNHRIQVFASTGAFLRKWGGTDPGDNQFNYPSGIAVDVSGNVYVADTYNHRIQVFSNTGAFLRKWEGGGSANGQLSYPSGIAVDVSGNVYVADTYNHRIQVFTNIGTFLRGWGGQGLGDGQFNYPYGLALDGSGNIYVADTNNRRIQVFTNTGVFSRKWRTYSDGTGQFNSPQGLASDKCGSRIYVADTINHRIQVFAEYGIPVATNLGYTNSRRGDWWASDVTVTLNAIGGCGVIQTWYILNGGAINEYKTPVTISMEGPNTLRYWSTSEGYEEISRNSVISIDKTPPYTKVTLSGESGNNGWYIDDVQVALSAVEAGSGLEKTEYSLDGANWNPYTSPLMVKNEGITNLYHRSIDMIGNVGPTTSRIKIDRTPPVITGSTLTSPNKKGWYKTNAVVHFTASDSVSGIDTTTPDIAISTEGVTQSVTGTVIDMAGLSTTVAVGGINIDKTPPQATIVKPAGEYFLNQEILADWIPSDILSGISSATGTAPSGRAVDTGTVGAKGFSIVVIDNAGNQVSQTATYYVHYSYSGILQPINSDGSSLFRLGSTIPVKFQLTDYGRNYISTGVARIHISKVSDNIAGDEMEAVSANIATIGNLFKYESASNEYIFNLGTKTLSPGTWQITISLDDGTSRYATVSLK